MTEQTHHDTAANVCPECGHNIRCFQADGRAERENGDPCDQEDCPMEFE